MAVTAIETVYLHVTGRCNMRCRYCYLDAGEHWAPDLERDVLERLLSDLVRMAPQRVVITGGEPLLRVDTLELGAGFRDRVGGRTQVCLSTNGMLVTRANVARIVASFDEVRVGIDALGPLNDQLRGTGAHDHALRALRLLSDAGGRAVASVTATAPNLPGLGGLMAELVACGIGRIHVTPVRPIGRATGAHELSCTLQEVNSAVARFWSERFGLTMATSEAAAADCGLGRFPTVYPDGSVYPCHMLAFPEFKLGSVCTDDLSEVLVRSCLAKAARSEHPCGVDCPGRAAGDPRVRARVAGRLRRNSARFAMPTSPEPQSAVSKSVSKERVP